MTGYGVPTPAPQQPGRSGPPLPVLDLVTAGLGLLVFILAFLPWVGIDCSDVPGEGRAECEKVSYAGWDLSVGTAGTVLLVVASALVARRLFDSTAPAVSTVPALLAVLGALLVVVQLVVGAPLLSIAVEFKGATKVGLYLVLVVALAEAAVAVVSWLQASGRMSRPAPAGAQLWDRPAQSAQPGADAGWPQQGYPPPAAPPGYGQQPAPAYGQQQPGYPPHPSQDYPGQDFPGQDYPGQERPARPARDYPPQGSYPDQGGYPQR
jgi:hypothetical protein